jgi:hypothetical protein
VFHTARLAQEYADELNLKEIYDDYY